mmetsp:Transcript_15713/g.49175  ORF Transcript_15713/g.49175 Transcript_15713/m.49175 type:complete len:82 (+) Transcript_15713:63-308(+)
MVSSDVVVFKIVVPICASLGALMLLVALGRLLREGYFRRQERKWSVHNMNFDSVEEAETITIEQPMKAPPSEELKERLDEV